MRRLTAIFFFIACTTPVISQILHQGESFIFNDNSPVPPGNNIFEALKYNQFNSHSEYIPSPGQSLTARIDPYLILPPDTGITGGVLPYDTGVVGTLPGSANVTPAGAFTYTIPLDLPAGISNMKPNLSLTYNSQFGAGMLGVGWSLTGTSAIARTGTNLYNDNYVSGVDFYKDKFTLDGNRLIAINNGVYGNPGTEYRTEIETFSKIVSYGTAGGAPESFKVWSKDGQIRYYGLTEDSRIRTNNRPDVVTWLISRIEDRQGNYISYTYTQDLQYGDFCLQKIEYTGNSDDQPFYSVNFTYEVKPDSGIYFIAGAEYKNSHRLSDISIMYLDTCFRSYHISYWPIDGFYSTSNTVNSLVKEITLKGKSNEILNPIRFEYSSSGEPSFSVPSSWMHEMFCEIEEWDSTHQRLMGDINGDGKADIVGFGKYHVSYSYSSGTIFLPPQTLQTDDFATEFGWDKFSETPIYLADINGDGKDDIVGFGGEDMKIAIANSIGFDDPFTFVSPFCREDGYGEDNFRIVTDINNDGRADIVAFGDDTVYYQLSTGTGFGTVIPSIRAFGTNSNWGELANSYCLLSFNTANYNSIYKYQRFLVDINGDGLKDILAFGSDRIYVAFSKSDPVQGYLGFEYPVQFDYPEGYYLPDVWEYKKCPGDINGDGKCDFVLCFPDKVYYYLSNGTGFDSPKIITNPDKIFCHWGLWDNCYVIIEMVDMNVDGKADLCGIGDYGVYVALSKGTYFEEPAQWTTAYATNEGWNNSRPRMFTEVTGDGNADIIGFDYEHVMVSSSVLANDNRLMKIRNALGSQVSIKYQSLAQHSPNEIVYTYPLRNFQVPIYVVDSLIEYTSYPSFLLTTYSFENPFFHQEGKGFLGFHDVIATNVLKGTTCRQHYHMDPTVFYPYVQTILTANPLGGYFTGLANELTILPFPDKRYFPYISASLEQKFDLNNTYVGATKSSTFIDLHGNMLQQKTLKGISQTLSLTSPDNDFELIVKDSTIYEQGDSVVWLPKKVTRVYQADGEADITKSSSIEHYPFGDNRFPLVKCKTVNSEPANNPMALKTSYDYDRFGNITSVIVTAPNAPPPGVDQRKTVLYYSPDYQYRFCTKKTVDPDHINLTEFSTFNPMFGTISSSVDVNGLVTKFYYDGFGTPSVTELPDGVRSEKVWRWALNHTDAPTGALYYSWEATSGSSEVLCFYDHFSNKLRTVTRGFNNSKIYSDIEYDSLNRISKVSKPYFAQSGTALKIVYTYDLLDRVTLITFPDNSQEKTIFNGREITRTTIVNGFPDQSNIKTVDAGGRLISSKDSSNAVNYTYYSDGNVKTTSIDSNSNTTIYNEYDVNGNCVKLKDPNFPNEGSIIYTYNPFGELVKTTNQKNQTVTTSYDALGRITVQQETEGVSRWYYDNPSKLKALGKVDYVTGPTENREYFYDSKGRISVEKRTFTEEGKEITYTTTYDLYSRQKDFQYSTGLTIRSKYNNKGFLEKISMITRQGETLLWTTISENALDQLLQTKLGNKITKSISYNVNTGLVDSIISINSTGNRLQDLEYSWNGFGNMISRREWIDRNTGNNLTETAEYDNLNRLNKVTLNSNKPTEFTYDALGNITNKYPLSNITYGSGATGVHAIQTAEIEDNNLYQHDQNITYTSFDKILEIKESDYSLSMEYGFDHQRISQKITLDNSLISEKHYFGYGFESEANSSGTRNLYYISGPTGIFAVVTQTEPTGFDLNYILTDHLGSFNVITDKDDNILEELSFDAWGRRRNPTDWTYTSISEPHLFDRGFTGHEHLDRFGLINMNGRLYDPINGRFLSPDNYIQAPDFTQSLNRYSYCLNNPLKYTDSSGEFWHIIIGAAVGGVINLAMNWDNVDGFWQGVVAFGVGAGAGAATAATGGAAGAGFCATAGVAAAGSAATMGTNSVIAQTGYNFSGMGNVDWGQVGISSVIGGVSGFAGGAAGYWAANSSMLVNGISSPVLRSAVVSPLAAGAGHIAGGTTAGLIQGQGFNEAFASSFNGLGQSMAFGAAIGVASTIGVSYANKISPWTGKPLNYNKTLQTQYDFSPDPYGDNVTMYRGTTGSEGNGCPLFMTDNPEYAATYVKNGGSVVKVTIPKSTYMQMQYNGHIQTYQGMHGTSYGLEYQIHPSVAPSILQLFKY